MDAKELWRVGRVLEAGQLLVRGIPLQQRPAWAAQVLQCALSQLGVHSVPMAKLVIMAHQAALWSDAKQIFDTLRDSTLRLERKRARNTQQERELRLHYLAENVAKVIYNASLPPDPFDDDSGDWIAVNLSDLVEPDRAWDSLSRNDFVG